MLRFKSVSTEKIRRGPLTRDKMIRLLERKGIRQIEGKDLDACYTFQLKMAQNYAGTGNIRFS